MKKRWITVPILGACVIAVSLWQGIGPEQLLQIPEKLKTLGKTQETQAPVYKTDTVKRGSVSVAVTEDGSVTFGTKEQVFTLDQTGTQKGQETVSDSSSGNMGAAGMSGGGNTAMQDAAAGGAQNTPSMGETSSGTSSDAGTSSGSEQETVEISLEVGEVYVRTGEVIEEGADLIGLTQDSIEECREKLEEAVASCKLQVQQEEINVESTRAEAEYNYNLYLAEGKTAKETYEATLASLDTAVEDIRGEMTEVQEQIDEYQEEIDNGYDYEDELEEEQEKYEDLEEELTLAKNNRTTQTIEAKKIYESAMTNYQYADQLYAIDTDGLEDALNQAKENLEDAEQVLEDFERVVGDGTIRAEYAGTVSSVSLAEGDTLTEDTVLIEVTDPEEAYVTVSVTQEDITAISVGDTASISLDAYPGQSFTGEVTSIDTSVSMGSATVNYSVQVRFTDSVSGVYAGMTGEVSFGVQSEDDVLYVSNQAVYQDGAVIYVKLLEPDGEIIRQEVTTGFSNGRYVEILSDLEEGQTVVIESGSSQ